MKNIKLNSRKELENFLKLVAQESVVKTLRESDVNIDKFKQQKNSDAKYFSSLKEENTEQSPVSKAPEEQDEEQDLPDEAVEDDDVNADIDKITPRMVIDKINNIRAGLSLKNKEIKENLITFLEKLDDNEILVLFYYLGDISKILNQKIKGQDAIDPSGAPLNISMTRNVDSQEEKNKEISKPKDQSKVAKEKSVEDTSPPIKVNEGQDKEEIRRQIRILMS